ncbi:cytochrome P450 [Amanita rubescens]|nr:cytochrome P450 [Amanita rubescens]
MASFPGQLQAIAVVSLCLIGIVIIHKRRNSLCLLLPPGPHKHFLSYNILPENCSYIQLEEWTRQYGPVFSLRQGYQTVIVINRLQAAIDIMEKEGAALADRPRNIPGDTLSGGMRLLFLPAGERLRKMRRALYAYLQPKIVATYGPILMERAKHHILGILNDPSSHQVHAKHFAASVVMILAYGITAERYDDPDIVAIEKCLRRLGESQLPGRWKVNTFPLLKYIPGYFKELHKAHAEELALFGGKLRQVREKMTRGEEAPDCFVRYLLERREELELSDDEAAYLAGSMFGAGTETTAATISASVLAAACHPAAQRRVQEELSSVVGERAPTSTDLDMLPQLHAFVLEVLRWRPASADGFGFAHKTTKEIIWKTYCIPKDTTVVGNVWSIGRDPQYFTDPEKFDPQRWISEDRQVREELKFFPFGFGRRVCPGQHIANVSVLLNNALLLWAFNIKEDPSSPIDPTAFRSSLITRPLPFSVMFEPRAAETAGGIRELLNDYGL